MTDRHKFVASARFTRTPEAGLWFMFRQRALLVSAALTPPEGITPFELGLVPVRTQFLGELGGTPCFAAELVADATAPVGLQFLDLLTLYRRTSSELMMLIGRALQIVEWDNTHQFCGRCGAPTEPHAHSRARVCTQGRCGLEQYPRVSPAMIVAVERGEEVLLARGPHFPPGIYGTLAGFVDPGESAEDAVHREVFEETGVRVENVRYCASQPWPFPHSLMLGFWADYVSGEVVPEAGEIEHAAFFHVDALPKLFPGRISVGSQLLADFCRRHGRPFPGDSRPEDNLPPA
ncbi:MAG: diphosphatase [Myxococcaceae bacterium]|nr:diphosphatase [Myxococcaceae bacterium]